ncbi:GH43 family beta-xylosidase/uncharacterized protein YjdB/lysophospholipase L1-like esterase [Paenibacillus phyllosphaerae]|uniref:GH43 family beta-xylosidase/uncharacterized protein YjdB/lysophospholipase L1-like esterase n=1 Tax=Paenibacillus phyllosphaerae TaxID=274593 RepID=A0A7W5B1W9_9BACL|nr:family 43 glycosylhydrolase [Paenibacillus phyllosphaerae]MBB3112853.1 GH43 family beta-xylosidase/uncharacterized protein YjdB/lysophospholipase L1-like esterase [Paenibacillus phyllosphaerae]
MKGKKQISMALALAMQVSAFAGGSVYAADSVTVESGSKAASGDLTAASLLAQSVSGNSFADDFSDGNVDGWSTYRSPNADFPGNWTVNDKGQLYVTNVNGGDLGSPGSKAVADGTSFKDFVYEGDLAVNGFNSDSSGFLFRVTNVSPDPQWDGYNGYYASLGHDGVVRLARVVGNDYAFAELASASVSVTSGHMKVVAIGNNIRIYMNDMDTPVIDYTDNDGKQITAAGAIGLRTWWGRTTFDNLTVNEIVPVAAPTFSPATGSTFAESARIAITSATPDAVIHYTTDGSVPTKESPVYNGPFTITETTTVKALAVKDGMFDSEVASASYAKQSVSFSDNFDSSTASNWKTYGGTWNLSGGTYNVNAGAGFKSVANATDFTNFSYSADVSISGGAANDNAGLLFRVTDPTVGADNLKGYYAGIRKGGSIQIGRFNNGWKELANIPYPIQTDTAYKLRVEAKGPNIDVYVNDELIASVVDRMWTHGAVGVRTHYLNAKFDNVSVTDTGAYTAPTYDWSWVKGAVFVPTNAVNQIQQWDQYDHEINERELANAHTYGINMVRVFVHNLLWKDDSEKMLANLEDFLQLADKYDIKVELVFFDDCWNDYPTLGEQPAPRYGAHNSRWVEGPGDEVKANYAANKADLKAYVQGIVKAHLNDPRIAMWNIYNEPSNGESGLMDQVTKQIMNDARIWIKDTGSAIPVTSTGGQFSGDPTSDFISWHPYEADYPTPYGISKEILADETMNRGSQTVPGVVEHYGDRGIGFVMWEFGIGRDNTRFAWGTDVNPAVSEPAIPFHGVVYPDGHPWQVNDVKALVGAEAFKTLPVFHAQYYNDPNFGQLTKTSITPRIDFELGDERGTGSPDASAGIGEDNFSIRWSGTVKPEATGTYTFYADSDNIASVWVNGTKVVDKTSDVREEASGQIQLTAGEEAAVKIEYVHADGDSSLHVKWAAPGGDKEALLPVFADKAAESVALPSQVNVAVDDTVRVPVQFSPLDASAQAVTWTSSNPLVASVHASTVDGIGEVRGEKAGTATITVASVADPSKTASVTVTVGEGDDQPAIPDSAIVDHFDGGTLDSAWQIVKESAANWSLSSRPGYLQLNAIQGDMYQSENGHHNVFIRDPKANANGDYEITLKLDSTVIKNYQQAGPIIWQDENNYIRLGRVYNGGKTLEFAKEVNGSYSGAGLMNRQQFPTGDRVYMKVVKLGNTYTPYVWNEGEWIQVAQTVTAELKNAKVGLYGLGATDATAMKASFDYFEVHPVEYGPATGVTLDKTALTLGLGGTYTLKANVEPLTAADKSVTWSSSNEAVATVSAGGVVTAVGPGLATITTETVSGHYTATSTVTVTAGSLFTNPIVPVGSGGGSADPWVIFQDGYYYYIRSDGDQGIQVAKASRLQDIGTAPRVTVYTPPLNTDYSKEIWAPELHFLNGKWYIYFAADDGDNFNHRMYVLESDTDNPQGSYTLKGKITDATDKWAIDGTVLKQEDGSLYFVWSGWEGDTNVRQNLYIAPMSNPWTISGPRVLISTPEKAWELNGTPYINEAPQVLQKDGKTFIVYSASGSWTDDYTLGMLTNTDGDVLNPNAWTKSGPVFSKVPTAYGPGHNSFTQSPDGTEDWIVYHADQVSGGSWGNRSVRAQKFTWNEDGTPNFGTPVGYGDAVLAPAGTPQVDTYRYEAEGADAQRGGTATIASESNASGGQVAGHIDLAGDYVQFNVNVKEAGAYRLTVMNANGTGGDFAPAKHDVTVNGASAGTITYRNYGWNIFNPSTMIVQLQAGANTIKLAKKVGYAEVDYIQLLRIPADQLVSGIQVASKSGQHTIAADKGTLQMTAKVLPASAMETHVTWKVTNTDGTPTDKASINAKGLLSALDNGIVRVEAYAADGSGKVGTYQVTISNQERVLKVMPLGASITHGFNIPGGYRIKLWDSIREAGYRVNFVGSIANGPAALGDNDHEGHPGWRIDQIDAEIDGWMEESRPDIVLLHAGTNDINQNYDVANMNVRLEALIDKITAKLPEGGKLYVAQIAPESNADWNAKVQQFNAKVAELVQKKAEAGQPVVLVDMYHALNVSDLQDGVHPTAAGYDKMADVWFEAIKGDFEQSQVSDTVTLTGPAAVSANQLFDVTLRLNEGAADAIAQDFTVHYDADKVEYVGAQSLQEGYTILDSAEIPGAIRFLAVNLQKDSASGRPLDLIKLQFKAKDTAENVTSSLSLTDIAFADSTGTETIIANPRPYAFEITAAVTRDALSAAIASAQSLHDSSVEGTRAGQYPVGSKAALLTAIQAAQAVLDNAGATQSQINEALEQLTTAVQTFRSLVIKQSAGDINGDNRYSIGDLSIAAAHYGKTNADPNWTTIKSVDLNNDGVIDIIDLVALARLILEEA